MRSILVADPDLQGSVTFGGALAGSSFSVVGTARSVKEVQERVRRLKPWGVAVDLALSGEPAAQGAGTIPVIRDLQLQGMTRCSSTFLPRHRGLVAMALRSGARSFIEKPYVREEIISALEHLAEDAPTLHFADRNRRIWRTIRMAYGVPAAPDSKIGTIRNLSETGVRFAAAEKLDLQSLLTARLDLPGQSTVDVRLLVVRECTERAVPGLTEYGAVLLDTDHGVRGLLRGFVDRVLQAESKALHSLGVVEGLAESLRADRTENKHRY